MTLVVALAQLAIGRSAGRRQDARRAATPIKLPTASPWTKGMSNGRLMDVQFAHTGTEEPGKLRRLKRRDDGAITGQSQHDGIALQSWFSQTAACARNWGTHAVRKSRLT